MLKMFDLAACHLVECRMDPSELKPKTPEPDSYFKIRILQLVASKSMLDRSSARLPARHLFRIKNRKPSPQPS